MPFGLRNAAATFQRLMDQILGDLPFVFVYLDDVLISSRTEAEHERDLEATIQKLSEAGLVINIEKSEFFKSEVDYLGHHISAAGLQPLTKHVEAVTSFPKPTNKTEVQRFAGLVNFFRTFIPGAAKLLQPLTDSLRKKAGDFNWSTQMEDSFNATKKALAEATTLRHPHPDANMRVATDASDTHIGGVLTQQDQHTGEFAPLAFYSKKLTPAEQNYSVFDRELLAAARAVKKWRHFLEHRQFELHTDHKPLIAALSKFTQADSARQQRQLTYLSEFNIKMIYIPGELNIDADAMSRPPATLNTVRDGNTPATWDEKELAAAQKADKDTRDLIKQLQNNSRYTLLSTGGSEVAKVMENKKKNQTVTRRTRIILPKSYQQSALQAVHNETHPGIRTTRRLLSARFIWHKMNVDAADFVRSCPDCQRGKITKHQSAAPGDFPVETRRFATVHLDIVGPLPESQDFKYLVTMIDRATRYPVAVPVKDITEDTVWTAFQDHWVATFGTPATLYTDRGAQFTAHDWASKCTVFGIKHRLTPAYHPQTNGLVERFHRTLKDSLRSLAAISDWPARMPLVLLGLRARPLSEAGLSPHQLAFGTELHLPGDFPSPDAEELDGQTFFDDLQRLRQGYKYPEAVHNTASGKEYCHRALQTSSHVLVKIDRVQGPLRPQYSGPFKVLRRGDHTYRIFDGIKEDDVAIDRLKPFHQRPGESPRPPTPPRRGRPPKRPAPPVSAADQAQPDLQLPPASEVTEPEEPPAQATSPPTSPSPSTTPGTPPSSRTRFFPARRSQRQGRGPREFWASF